VEDVFAPVASGGEVIDSAGEFETEGRLMGKISHGRVESYGLTPKGFY